MADNLAKDLIPTKEEALKVAYLNQVELESQVEDIEANRANTLEDIMQAARDAGKGDLVDEFNQYVVDLESASNELKEAKKQTDLAKAEFSMTVLLAAEGVKGRSTHANVNIVSSTEVEFPMNDPVKMGRAVEWLLSAQEVEPKVLEMISIKTSPISFFQKAAENGTLPKMFGSPVPLITVREGTATRVDSLDKWIAIETPEVVD